MKLKQYRKTRIPMINRKEKTIRFEPKKVLGTYTILKDKTGKEYQIFFQDELDYVKDLRVNNPKIGVVTKQAFMAIGFYETYRDDIEKITEKFATLEVENKVVEMISNYKEVEL